MFCIFIAFAILAGRLFYLQIVEGEEYRRLSENNCIRLQSLDAPRGLILDRNKKLLVDNRPSFDLSIIMKDAKPLATTLQRLSDCTGISLEDFQNAIERNRQGNTYKPILLKQDIGRNALAVIAARRFDLPGVVVDIKPRRNYIYEGSAAHVLGYLSEISGAELKSGRYPRNRPGDYIGKYGVEKTFEKYLRGKRGGQQVEVNATGQVVRVIKTVDAIPGSNVVLTIDHRLQQKAEALLAGKAGAVVAIEPATGYVLVLASSPTFNQNAFVSGMSQSYWDSLRLNPDHPMTNKAIQAEYPPASTYKIVTAMGALQEEVLGLEDTAFCPGYYRYGDRIFRCWKRGGHGHVNVTDALAQSCDVYFYQAGQKLGVDRLAWYAKACGLGKLTGIALDHEAAGLIPTSDWKYRRFGVPWQGGETLSVAIGQGYNLATPLQMAVLTAAVGYDGVRRKPIILRAIETVEGETIKVSRPKPIGRIPAGQETLDIIRKGLWEVVNNRRGTAWVARLPDVSVSGKTGTAQVVSSKRDERGNPLEISDDLKPHAWFVAYAPSEKPRIAMSVLVEHGEHGSSAGGPIARELIKAYLSESVESGTSDPAKSPNSSIAEFSKSKTKKRKRPDYDV